VGVSGLHVACFATIGIALPLAARIAGSETFDYTMFSQTTMYSIAIIATDREGHRTQISPSSLASSLSPAARPFVSGADQPHRARSVGVLRAHLNDLARVACEQSEARAIDVTLVERADDQRPDGAAMHTEAHAECR
jgi:hypothetical protein